MPAIPGTPANSRHGPTAVWIHVLSLFAGFVLFVSDNGFDSRESVAVMSVSAISTLVLMVWSLTLATRALVNRETGAWRATMIALLTLDLLPICVYALYTAGKCLRLGHWIGNYSVVYIFLLVGVLIISGATYSATIFVGQSMHDRRFLCVHESIARTALLIQLVFVVLLFAVPAGTVLLVPIICVVGLCVMSRAIRSMIEEHRVAVPLVLMLLSFADFPLLVYVVLAAFL